MSQWAKRTSCPVAKRLEETMNEIDDLTEALQVLSKQLGEQSVDKDQVRAFAGAGPRMTLN